MERVESSNEVADMRVFKRTTLIGVVFKTSQKLEILRNP